MADDTGLPHEIPFLEPADPPSIHGITSAMAAQIAERLDAMVPSGSLLATARSTAPSGYLLCDGAAVSRTTYADLFAAISTAYGVGNGSTTFNVPDLRGRVPVGVDGTAGRMSSADTLAMTGGTEAAAITTGELPPHTHDFGGNRVPAGSAVSNVFVNGGGSTNVPAIVTISSPNATGNGPGTSTPRSNMQPYLIVNYLIKT